MNILPLSVLAVNGTLQFMRPALIVLVLVLAALVLSSIVFTVLNMKAGKSTGLRKLLLGAIYAATVIVLACTILCLYRYNTLNDALLGNNTTVSTTTDAVAQTTLESTLESTVETTTVPETEPDPAVNPAYTDKSNPDNWGIKWDVIQSGSIVESYNRNTTISFGDASAYTACEGITTFRGDNYRTGATYGTANISDETITDVWNRKVGSYNRWSGIGWTGQPLIVRWDDATKAIMNLYDDKKAKEDLVEVIYATLDGYIYFYDLEDGSYTRDPLWMGMNFKGAGSLDPRGYPILYVGSGDFYPTADYSGQPPRMYVISLIDTTIMYEKSGNDSFKKRSWCAFDAAPLVNAETDTLIWPGESGMIYTIQLNTQFDLEAGTLSVQPEETAKARYTTKTGRTLGFESSPIVVDGYLYCGDNGGMFFCVNLNTMELMWAQNIRDDLNATPVFEWGEDGNGYLYLATSLEFSPGTAYIYKLNASTGEIVWQKNYDNVAYNESVSGGALSSPLLGKAGTSLEGMIVFTIARTPHSYDGALVALDKQTGEVIWENYMPTYTWSSPVAVYTDEGKGYIVLCDAAGNVDLLDGATGKELDTFSVGWNIEASPAVFEDMIVVGTKGQQVYAFKVE